MLAVMNLRKILIILPLVMLGAIVLAKMAGKMGNAPWQYDLLIVAGVIFWILVVQRIIGFIDLMHQDMHSLAVLNKISASNMWGRILKKSMLYVIVPASVFTAIVIIAAYVYVSLK